MEWIREGGQHDPAVECTALGHDGACLPGLVDRSSVFQRSVQLARKVRMESSRAKHTRCAQWRAQVQLFVHLAMLFIYFSIFTHLLVLSFSMHVWRRLRIAMLFNGTSRLLDSRLMKGDFVFVLCSLKWILAGSLSIFFFFFIEPRHIFYMRKPHNAPVNKMWPKSQSTG